MPNRCLKRFLSVTRVEPSCGLTVGKVRLDFREPFRNWLAISSDTLPAIHFALTERPLFGFVTTYGSIAIRKVMPATAIRSRRCPFYTFSAPGSRMAHTASGIGLDYYGASAEHQTKVEIGLIAILVKLRLCGSKETRLSMLLTGTPEIPSLWKESVLWIRKQVAEVKTVQTLKTYWYISKTFCSGGGIQIRSRLNGKADKPKSEQSHSLDFVTRENGNPKPLAGLRSRFNSDSHIEGSNPSPNSPLIK